MLVSLLMLTIDRFDKTPDVWKHNLRTAGHGRYNIETLVCDNGSTDKRIVRFFADQKIAYHRVNSRNEGIGHSLNQLFLRAKGDIIASVGNDIEMPDGWLKEALYYIDNVPDCGIVGFDWGHGGMPPLSERNGIKAKWLTADKNRIFGNWVMHRRVIEKIGFFHEGYGPYGIEDSDFNERVNRSGFQSLYHPTLTSKHVVWDVGHQTAYRKMKDESLQKNCGIFGARLQEFDKGGSLVEPLPPMREPIWFGLGRDVFRTRTNKNEE